MPTPKAEKRSVLIFHGIGTPERVLERDEARFWMDVPMFRGILDRIAAMGSAAPEITFDDGNASDLRIALPELEARGLRATFFLLTGRLGQTGSLSGDDVRILAQAGQRIGLHGHAHRDWRRLDAAGRRVEFRTARDRLSDLACTRVDLAAAPFGLYDRRVSGWVANEGFSALYTSDRGVAPRGAFLQPRNCMEGTMGSEAIEQALTGRLPMRRRLRRLAGMARKRLLPLQGAA